MMSKETPPTYNEERAAEKIEKRLADHFAYSRLKMSRGRPTNFTFVAIKQEFGLLPDESKRIFNLVTQRPDCSVSKSVRCPRCRESLGFQEGQEVYTCDVCRNARPFEPTQEDIVLTGILSDRKKVLRDLASEADSLARRMRSEGFEQIANTLTTIEKSLLEEL